MIINSKHVGGGAEPVINPLSVTENGTYTAPEGVDGYSPVTVNVPQEGIDALLYTNTSPTFDNRYPSENPVIYCPLVAVWDKCFYLTYEYGRFSPYKTITIKSDVPITSMSDFCRNEGKTVVLEKIIIDADLSACTNYSRFIANQNALKEIVTPFDFTAVTIAGYSNWNFYSAPTAELKVKYVENTLHVNHNISAIKFTDDALVSVANGLQSGAHTITLHANMKAKCPTIMGTVSQVTDGEVTYDFFTASESGTVTLENFITQTKGWTIA